MSVGSVLVLLGVLLYAAWVRDAHRQCRGALDRGLRQAAEIAHATYAEYADCAFDAALTGACSIPRADAFAAPSAAVAAAAAAPSHAYGARTTTEISASLWCTAIDSLPDPLAHLGVFADTRAAGPVGLVISQDRLRTHEATLAEFRRQCDCGWPWWRYHAYYDHKVSYEFTRTGLVADAILAEIRRAGPFYARFGGAVDTWIASVNRPGGEDQIMSDHGMLLRDTDQHIALIMRYILVVYSAPSRETVAAVAAAPASRFALWGDSGGGGGGAGGGASPTAVGTFTLCMSEVQITTWPAVADCRCVRDPTLHQRLRETVDARMKKHFADSASTVLRALPDTFPDNASGGGGSESEAPPPPPLRALPQRAAPAPQPLSSMDTL